MKYRDIELPDNLRDIAKEYIISVLDELADNDKLNKLDSASYYILASQFNTYLGALEEQNQKGITTVSHNGNISVAPWSKVLKDSLIAVTRISQELGLTIRSRKSLKVLENDANEEESPLSKFMKQNEEY